jgi:Amt family ammonium transporter
MAIDLGSTALIFACMAMVQFMTPGLAFFYAGLVPSTSAVSMMIQNFVTLGIITILWYLFLYSMCFGESIGFFGNP